MNFLSLRCIFSCQLASLSTIPCHRCIREFAVQSVGLDVVYIVRSIFRISFLTQILLCKNEN
jgi:hypothetical protein